MALDRPDEAARADEVGRADVAGARAEVVEPRTRGEYYEALRAAVGGAADGRSGDERSGDERSGDERSSDERSGDERSVAGDSGGDRSGWDSVDAADRPAPEAIRVSPERTVHILDGDPGGGGGHRHGVGKPGKTEFPASWDDKKIVESLLDVARRPDLPPKQQERNDRWVARGTRDDVGIVVVIARDGHIWTAWPTPGSPGVVKNRRSRDGNG